MKSMPSFFITHGHEIFIILDSEIDLNLAKASGPAGWAPFVRKNQTNQMTTSIRDYR